MHDTLCSEETLQPGFPYTPGLDPVPLWSPVNMVLREDPLWVSFECGIGEVAAVLATLGSTLPHCLRVCSVPSHGLTKSGLGGVREEPHFRGIASHV